jgi:hypothetical protein
MRFLTAYSVLLTAAFFFIAAKPSPNVLTVERINVVEPDGTLRMVISDHARLPGIITKGKEQKFDRPQAGMIFYNDEGSENGGLIFGGHKNAKGEVVDSGGSLSFDKYDANQIVQLAGVDDKEDKFAGLSITDSPTGSDVRRAFGSAGAMMEPRRLRSATDRERSGWCFPSPRTARRAFRFSTRMGKSFVSCRDQRGICTPYFLPR